MFGENADVAMNPYELSDVDRKCVGCVEVAVQ